MITHNHHFTIYEDSVDFSNRTHIKNILLDNSAIVKLIEYNQEDILVKLKQAGIILHIIHPTKLEFLCYPNGKIRLKRLALLSDLDITILRFNSTDRRFEQSCDKIQTKLFNLSFTPGAIDIMLASTLDYYKDSTEPFAILTADIKDFPNILFKRQEIITLESQKDIRHLVILTLKK